MILHGDALAMLQTLQDNSVDSLCCDPPAGIHFMNKEFDHDKGGRGPWVAWLAGIMRECLRVMKPGASGLVWSLPRTSHWTALALEDAGFEIRDSLYHLYPPSSKVIAFCESLSEEQQNLFAQVLDSQSTPASIIHAFGSGFPKSSNIGLKLKEMQGWHTGLKPSVELWWLIRKPISEATIAKNIVKWGTGALNIDGCRVGTSSTPRNDPKNGKLTISHMEIRPWMQRRIEENLPLKKDFSGTQGRFPSHLLLSHTLFCVPLGPRKVDIDGCAATLDHTKKVSDIYGHIAVVTQHAGYKDANGQEEIMAYDCSPDCPVRLLDEQSGTSKSSNATRHYAASNGLIYHASAERETGGYTDQGGASRYFQQFYYAPKASRSERNKGCGELEEGERNVFSNTQGTPEHTPRRNEKQQNTHPTVKNLSLIRYLLRLLTPPGGGGGSALTALRGRVQQALHVLKRDLTTFL